MCRALPALGVVSEECYTFRCTYVTVVGAQETRTLSFDVLSLLRRLGRQPRDRRGNRCVWKIVHSVGPKLAIEEIGFAFSAERPEIFHVWKLCTFLR